MVFLSNPGARGRHPGAPGDRTHPATAGGSDQFAKVARIKIFRREGRKTVIIPFDHDDVIAGKNLESNILLRRGDVVVVP